MMSTKTRKSLDRILECPICQEQLRNATQLCCGHTFCRECLKDVIVSQTDADQEGTSSAGARAVKLPCPCCRKVESVKINNKKVNVALNQIVEVLSDDNQTDNPSTSKLNASESWLSICDKHPEYVKKYACEACKLDVCSECVINDHYNHDHDRPMTLSDMKDTLSDALIKSDNWERDNGNLEKHIDLVKKQGTQTEDVLIKGVEDEYKHMVNELNQKKDRLLSTIRDKAGKFNQELDVVVRKRKATASKIREISARVRNGIEQGAASDIINTYSSYAKRLKEEVKVRVDSK